MTHLNIFFSNLSPRVASLYTPPTTLILSTTKPLLDALDNHNLHKPSSSQQQVSESIPQQVTRASPGLSVSPQAEEATPPMSQETHEGTSSVTTTKIVETIVSQLDRSYIIKPP
ncbi:hypothetical protein Hanom_Chr10g00914511 [Helianthus anomalus]